MKKEKIIQSIINDSKKIFHNVKRIPWFLGSHAFLVILLLIMFDLLVGSYLYYQYIYLAQNKDPIKSRKQVILDDEIADMVLRKVMQDPAYIEAFSLFDLDKMTEGDFMKVLGDLMLKYKNELGKDNN